MLPRPPRYRPHPLRLAALTCIFAGIVMITVFAGGIHTGATQADAAKALVKFLTSPQAVPVIKKKGMEPG